MTLIRGNTSLYWKTGLDNDQLKADSKQATGIIKGLASRVTKADVFAGLAISGAMALKKLSKEAYQFSKDFEQRMLEVKTISGEAQSNFEGFSQSVIDLSKDAPQSANELAEALYQIVSAGYDGAAGLRLLKTASKTAVGGVTNVKIAADGLTTVLNAWGIAAKDVDKVSDQLFQTVKLGKTTIGEISGSLAQVAPLAASFGVELDEVLGALATLTKQGVPTAQAFTHIRSSLISMSEVLGDGWALMYTYQEAVAAVAEKAGGSETKLREMMGRVEAMNAVLGLTGKNAQMAASDLALVGNSAGAADKAFRDMVVSNTNQLKILANNINAKLKPLGDSLLKISSQAAKSINKLFDDTGDGVEDIVIKMQQEMFKVKSLFSILKNAEKGSREYARAIEEINKAYGEYLPNQLTDRDNLLEIEKAQRAVTNALLAHIAVQQVEAQISEKLGDFAEDFENKFAGIAKRLTKRKGVGVTTLFIQALNEGLDTAIERGEANLKGVVKFSKTAYDLWDKFLKQTGIGYTEFEKKFFSIIKEKQKVNQNIAELDAFAEAYKNVLDKFNKAAQDAGGGGEGKGGKPTGTTVLNEYQKLVAVINELEAEIKKLYEAEGQLDRQAIRLTKTKLEAKQKELELLEKQLEANQKLTKLAALPPKSQASGKLAPMQQIIMPKTTLFDGDALGKQTDDLGELSQILNDVSAELRAMNPEMAQMVGNLSNMATGFQNILVGISANPMAGIMGAVQVYSSIMGIITESKSQEQLRNEANMQLENTIERINEKLEYQLSLVTGLREGTEEYDFKFAQGQVEELTEELEHFKEQLQFTKDDKMFGQEFGRVMQEIFTLGTANTEKHKDTLKRYEELIAQTEMEIEELQAMLPELEEEWQNALSMGITEADIAGQIKSAFDDGVGTVEEFGDITKNILQQAFIESIFSQEVIKKYMSEAQDSLISALEDGELTQGEIDEMNKVTEGLRNQLNTMFEGLNELDLFGEETKASLAGQIKQSITADQASMIEGLLRHIVRTIGGNAEAMGTMNDYLSQIAENTSYNRDYLPLLSSIDSKISNLNDLTRGSGVTV